MGNPSRPELHPRVAVWGETFREVARELPTIPVIGALRLLFDFELKEYFRLCALARSHSAMQELSSRATSRIFSARVSLEKSIIRSIDLAKCETNAKLAAVLKRSFYGYSKKQGTSIRMPLVTCQPTAICGAGCYAHDVLDATPFAVVRGAINGWLAELYEKGGSEIRSSIIDKLAPHSLRAIRSAFAEVKVLPSGYKRRAYIRFSHVGEIVAYPNFANALASQVIALSNGQVDCVVYTRHRNAAKLDPKLWVINFTLDERSLKRKSWVPIHARIVYSAFGGRISPIADINFLEHHRHSHYGKTNGEGQICPATLPETKIRSCDACRCCRCFVPPNSSPQIEN